MVYDRFAYQSQELKGKIQDFGEAWQRFEGFEGRGKSEKKAMETALAKKAEPLLQGGQRHLAYHGLCLQHKDAADELRSQMTISNTAQELARIPTESIRKLIEQPAIKIDILPPYSAVFKLSLKLDKPYLSRDENLFCIIDNPIRRDKVFGQPYVAATSWKGSLRSALRSLDSEKYSDDGEIVSRLFGNKRAIEDEEAMRSGRLYFYPTFFDKIGLEVINPHDRATRTGRQPIYLECAPAGAQGLFTLLYVPFDRAGMSGKQEQRKTLEQVGEDLQSVALGLQAMLTVYGFGAKTSSGYGLIKNSSLEGNLIVKVVIGNMEELPPQLPVERTLPRYLEAPDRLIAKFRNEDGSFLEYHEEQILRFSKQDRQLYDKAKKWWQREGKHLYEMQIVQGKTSKPEVLAPEAKTQYFSRQFSTFDELQICVRDLVSALRKEEENNGRQP